jgi:hypothetical protein
MHSYVWARINPFTAPACGIPKGLSAQSSKHKSWSRGVLSTSSTTGVGFVLIRPSPAFDTVVATYTDSSYADNKFETNNAVTGVNAGYPNCPYQSADFTSGDARSRLVSYGVRVRYTGTELQKSGRLLAFCHPTGETLNGGTFSTLTSFPSAHTVPVSRKWTAVVGRSVAAAGASSSNVAGWQFSNSTTFDRNHSVGIIIEADAAVSYEFEFYEIYEVIASNMHSPTDSHNSSSHVDAVDGVIDKLPTEKLDTYANSDSSLVGTVKQGLTDAGNLAKDVENILVQGAEVVGGFLAWLV